MAMKVDEALALSLRRDQVANRLRIGYAFDLFIRVNRGRRGDGQITDPDYSGEDSLIDFDGSDVAHDQLPIALGEKPPL